MTEQLGTEKKSEVSRWKKQLSEIGYLTCRHDKCKLSFLSLSGMVAHDKNCRGLSLSAGNYLTCGNCQIRFRHFKSLKTHQEKHTFAADSTTSSSPDTKEIHFEESSEEKNQRILMESREISGTSTPNTHKVYSQRKFMTSTPKVVKETSKPSSPNESLKKEYESIELAEAQLANYKDYVTRTEELAEIAKNKSSLSVKRQQLQLVEKNLYSRFLKAQKTINSIFESNIKGEARKCKILRPTKTPSNSNEVYVTSSGVKYILPSIPQISRKVSESSDTKINEFINRGRNNLISELLKPPSPSTETLESSNLQSSLQFYNSKNEENYEDDIKEILPEIHPEIIPQKILTEKITDEEKENEKESEKGKEKEKESEKKKESEKEKERNKESEKDKEKERNKESEKEKEKETEKKKESEKEKEKDEETETEEEKDTKSSEIELEKSVKRRRDESNEPLFHRKKKTHEIECGKCEKSFKNKTLFEEHAISYHGNVVRPKGESQSFTPEEIYELIKEAFTLYKKVVCYICLSKSFTSRLGLEYHIRLCGKTKEEREADKVKCDFCHYKGIPQLLLTHVRRNHSSPKEENNVHETLGRGQRSAAKKAMKEFSKNKSHENHNKNKESNKDEDDEEYEENDKNKNDDEDDDEKDGDFELDDYFEKKDGKIQCKTCNFNCESKDVMSSHVLNSHSEQVEGFDEFSKPRIRNYKGRAMPQLTNWTEYIELEFNFRESNYSKTQLIFSTLKAESSKWTIVKEPNSYIPQTENSVTFTVVSPLTKMSQEISLKRFESVVSNEESSTIFTGGPIWAADWAPLQSSESKSQILGLSTHSAMNTTAPLLSSISCLGLIQIWSTFPPRFEYGLCHNYGLIWSLSWCPSGGETKDFWGILAVGGSDGKIRIHRMPKNIKPNSFLSHDPDLILEPFESFGQVYKISWFRGFGHRVIGASYANGCIALYDLQTKSSLLLSDIFLHPYLAFQCHYSSLTSFDLIDSEDDGRPRFLATGSSDRNHAVWDLRTPNAPLASIKKGFVTDIHWEPHYNGSVIFVSHDDVYLQGHTSSLLTDIGDGKTSSIPIISQNSPIRSGAVNNWIGSYCVCTSGGEVLIYIANTHSQIFEYDKNLSKRRILVFRTEVKEEQDTGMSQSEDNSSMNYETVKNNKLHFVDLNLKDLKSNESEWEKSRLHQSLAEENITKFPLSSINRIAFNPNVSHFENLFSGLQSGLGRFHRIESFKNDEAASLLHKLLASQ